ncbi:MAG: DUF177 domain-containing protein [SAR324 cluster bacterium]|nr:DUF177 domain-containing protein [SAR324 cluster bacterium]
MQLQVKIHDLSQEELVLEAFPAPSDYERIQEAIGPQKEPFHYILKLSRQGDRITLNGHMYGHWKLICDRCLSPYQYDQEEIFQTQFLPEQEVPVESETILSLNDLETEFYQGDCLELKDLLEDQILLGIPFKKLCTKECLGRCSRCGINLNEQHCECSRMIDPDHPFAALSQLIQK